MHLKRLTLRTETFTDTGTYPFSLPHFRRPVVLDFPSPVTFFIGENGTGKSTLLRALARRCGLHIWGALEEPNRRDRAFREAMDVEWNEGPVSGSHFCSELFHNFTRIVEEWAEDDPSILEYFGGRSLVTQSHGQGLLSYFRSRYKIRGLYFMDEPETALSPRSQLELLRVISETTASGVAQFVIASHSPILLSCPGAVLYTFDDAPIRPILYEETTCFRFYQDFMNDRSRFLPHAQRGLTATGRQ